MRATDFFYANPLAAYPGVNPQGRWHDTMENGHHRRVPWFHCPCCPPNIARLIASIGEYSPIRRPANRIYVQIYHDNAVVVWMSPVMMSGLCTVDANTLGTAGDAD